MKNLTDFLKTVETGLDPRLLRVFVDLIQLLFYSPISHFLRSMLSTSQPV